MSYCLTAQTHRQPKTPTTPQRQMRHHENKKKVVDINIPGDEKMPIPLYTLTQVQNNSGNCLFIKMKKIAVYIYGYFQDGGYHRKLLLDWDYEIEKLERAAPHKIIGSNAHPYDINEEVIMGYKIDKNKITNSYKFIQNNYMTVKAKKIIEMFINEGITEVYFVKNNYVKHTLVTECNADPTGFENLRNSRPVTLPKDIFIEDTVDYLRMSINQLKAIPKELATHGYKNLTDTQMENMFSVGNIIPKGGNTLFLHPTEMYSIIHVGGGRFTCRYITFLNYDDSLLGLNMMVMTDINLSYTKVTECEEALIMKDGLRINKFSSSVKTIDKLWTFIKKVFPGFSFNKTDSLYMFYQPNGYKSSILLNEDIGKQNVNPYLGPMILLNSEIKLKPDVHYKIGNVSLVKNKTSVKDGQRGCISLSEYLKSPSVKVEKHTDKVTNVVDAGGQEGTGEEGIGEEGIGEATGGETGGATGGATGNQDIDDWETSGETSEEETEGDDIEDTTEVLEKEKGTQQIVSRPKKKRKKKKRKNRQYKNHTYIDI